ncbi:5-fold beta-flower protein [Spirosoma litoris]
MKSLALVFLFVCLVTSPFYTYAQGANYKQPMTINATGQVKDVTGATIGLVTKDKMIQDAKGHKMAFVDGQGNLVDAKTNKKLGHMGKDGKTYMDANGDLMFTIKNNPDKTCDIFNAKGKKIGNVHESYKGTACALHCFENQHTHMNKQ